MNIFIFFFLYIDYINYSSGDKEIIKRTGLISGGRAPKEESLGRIHRNKTFDQ